MAGTITLSYGGDAITVGGVMHPDEPGLTYPQVLGYTWGGTPKVADFGIGTNWQRPVIHFRQMSATHYGLLKTFITTTVNWHERAFTMVNAWGTTITNLHYVSGWETFQSSKGDRWNGTLVFQKDIGA